MMIADDPWFVSPPCEEGCTSAHRYCHCQNCGETGVAINFNGYCLQCQEKIEKQIEMEIPF